MSVLSLPPTPIETPGVFFDDTPEVAARKVLRFHFERMLQNEPGTLHGEDIERLHDMRVATRRMRVAFKVFGVRFEMPGSKKILKKTARELGDVRDLDVFMEKTRLYTEDLSESERRGLDPLVAAWSKKHRSARGVLRSHLTSEEFQDFKSQFDRLESCCEVLLNDPYPTVSEAIAALISPRLEDVYRLGNSLQAPSIIQLHALRIAFKSLRYTTEFFVDILEDTAYMRCIELLKQIQDYLGDANDAKFSTALLDELSQGWPAHDLSPDQDEAIAAMIEYRRSELDRLVAAFPPIWQQFVSGKFQQNLSDAIRLGRGISQAGEIL